jgi:hypothetical protein
MAYPADPGGIFPSDVHRRVLAHLSHPEDKFGWNVEALINRLRTDRGDYFSDNGELSKVLNELKEAGHAVLHEGGIWQQTKEGFEKLTGEAAVEATQGPTGPATVYAATPIGEPVPEAPGQGAPTPALIEPTAPAAQDGATTATPGAPA